MIHFHINGREVAAEEGDTILNVAAAHDIFIPALCHHKAVAPYGACRLCLAEVDKGGRKRVVASCSYVVAEGISVDTHAPAAVHARNVAMELLLARSPKNGQLRALAAKMGVTATRFEAEKDDCILCGLCVRVCREVVKQDCLAFVGRGPNRRVGTPYGKPSQRCLACGACVAVCPTGALHRENAGLAEVLPEWTTVVRRAKCPECGQHFASSRQLDRVRSQAAALADVLSLCPRCRREQLARKEVLWNSTNPGCSASS